MEPVIVAGAGIAGLALATSLTRAGVPVMVLERHEQLAETGAGISLWPNALAALDVIGVGGIVREAGAPVSGGAIRRPDGSWIRRVGNDFLPSVLGEPAVAIHRGDLLQILAAPLPADTVRYGWNVAGHSEPEPGAVAVRSADGRRLKGSLLVGADGVASTVAASLAGSLSPVPAGYTAWRGVAPVRVSDGEAAETWGGDGREFGVVPLGSESTYWFATENATEGERRPEGEMVYLRRRFADWHPPIPELLAATAEDAVLRHDIYDRKALPRWRSGRVLVIGDAAHPMRPHLGQGGCQAIEDAVAVGSAIGRAVGDGRDPIERLDETLRRRRDRILGIVRESAAMGNLIQGTAPWHRLGRRAAGVVPIRALGRHLRSIAGAEAFARAVDDG